jgi:hypothetical protein
VIGADTIVTGAVFGASIGASYAIVTILIDAIKIKVRRIRHIHSQQHLFDKYG